jgi:transaldolase/glucose-6-phosphate isomerase
LSRIDSSVDALLDTRVSSSTSERERSELSRLKGKVAIANAKQTYQRYLRLFSSPRWEALVRKGAQPQRVLWASTGTKNPAYRDVLYVEELIGPHTVNTMPLATLDAFRDHGKPQARLIEGVQNADATMASVARLGIRMEDVTDGLLEDGIRLFAEAFDGLLTALKARTGAVRANA